MTSFTFRALPDWPHPSTRDRRWRPFKASYSDTESLIERELRHLNATAVILAAGFRDRDLRIDGTPRANAPQPTHPGVELSFDTPRVQRGRRLVYATDACHHWQDNVRSIALGLEALRAVDRYGITRHGEQYAGWLQITTGADDHPTIGRGRALIREAGGDVRAAKRATHPDAGGNRLDFESVIMAERAIDEVGA